MSTICPMLELNFLYSDPRLLFNHNRSKATACIFNIYLYFYTLKYNN